MEHPEKLRQEKFDAQAGQALPEREAMSTLTLDPSGVDHFAMPINEARALNYESTDSVAFAIAEQTVILTQADSNPYPGSLDDSADDTTPGRKHHG